MAGRFRFRLESLLKLRKSLEQEAQRHLGRTVAQRNEVEARLQDLNLRHQQALESRRTETGQPIDLTFWRAVERWLVVLEQRIEAASEELRQAEAQVEAARKALTKAHQEHLMLLRLKERRKALHDLELIREEAAAADELAVLRHRFQSRSAS
jgi:flagellar export protein FliJ